MADWVRPVSDLGRVVVVSPHFDDAVQGASSVLAHYPGTVVITVLAGWPPAYPDAPSEWDALGGFQPGDDVVAIRRVEDADAMAVFDAVPVWLDFPDHQYLPKDERPRPEDIAPALEAAILDAEPDAVFFPFGLANPDHDRTHRAVRIVADRHPELIWFCYEDGGYSHLPGLLAWRISSLFQAGWWPTPAIVPATLDHERKRRAVECYRSQVPPLRADHLLDERLGAPVPEQFWRLEAPPPGWEGLASAPG